MTLISVLLLSSATIAAQQPVSGIVLDATGQPAVKAVVRPINLGEDTVLTDEQGQFTISLTELNSWESLQAFSADGMEHGRMRIKLQEGNPAVPKITIRMTKEVRTITGTIFDPDGNPVDGAIVGGDGWGWGSRSFCTTGPDGTFRFLWEKEAPLLRIYAVKENVGFNFVGTMEQREDKGPTPPERITDGPFSITLPKPQAVKIHVTDIDERPLAGSRVVVAYLYKPRPESDENENNPRVENEQSFGTYHGPPIFQTKTDENGNAEFNWIPSEGYRRIEFWGYGPKGDLDDGDEDFAYGAGEAEYSFKNQKDVTIQIPQFARLKGKVVYSDGSSASWVRVSVNYENGHGIRFADADGVFELTGKPGTIVNIGIESTKEATPGIFRFNLGDGSEVHRPTFKLKKGTKLQGIIFHPDSTPCQDDFWIRISERSPDPTRPDDGITRQTSFDEGVKFGGHYQFILPPGSFEIRATCGQLQSVQKEFNVAADQEEIWMDLQLENDELWAKSQRLRDREVSATAGQFVIIKFFTNLFFEGIC